MKVSTRILTASVALTQLVIWLCVLAYGYGQISAEISALRRDMTEVKLIVERLQTKQLAQFNVITERE